MQVIIVVQKWVFKYLDLINRKIKWNLKILFTFSHFLMYLSSVHKHLQYWQTNTQSGLPVRLCSARATSAQSCWHCVGVESKGEFSLTKSYNLTLRKIAIWLSINCPKLDIFSKNFHFFQKNWQWQFFWKNMKIFGNFFEKMSTFWQIFDSQMVIFRRVRFQCCVKYWNLFLE